MIPRQAVVMSGAHRCTKELLPLARRKKAKKGTVAGYAVVIALGLLFSGSANKDADTPMTSPAPTVTVAAQATSIPAPTAIPKPTPTPSPTPTPTPTPIPTTVPDDLVWVSHSGSRYHRISTCSDMNDPTPMTEAEAIQIGRKPCGSCFH